METIRQAQQVRALAKYRSFRKAAEHLNISQSSLSQTIARLEDIYGVPLFDRNRNGVSLTSYGELVLESASRAINMLEETRREVSLLQNFQTGRLVIGCEAHLTDAYIAPPLATMVSKYPNLRYTIESGKWSDLERKLQDRQIDIFFGLLPDAPVNDHQVERVLLPPSVVYCRTGHPLLSADDPATHLNNHTYPFITPVVPAWLIQHAIEKQSEDSLFSNNVQSQDFIFVSNDAAANKHVVMNSDALTAHYYNAIEAEILAGKLELVPDDRTLLFDPFPAVIITEAGRVLSPAMEEFITVLKQHIELFEKQEHQRRKNEV